jgi:hypothetical protein
MIGDPFQRFVIMKQSRPVDYLVHTTFDGINSTIQPLSWELIDRGEKFEVWKEKSVDEKILARFATEEEAFALRTYLVSMTLRVQVLEEELRAAKDVAMAFMPF